MSPSPRSRRPPRRHIVEMLLATSLVAVSLIAPSRQTAQAADLSLFEPGHIISDSIFYDWTTMTAAAVDAFFGAKGSACVPGPDGTPCLKDYTETTWTRPADAKCAGTYNGGAGESAGTIITKVATACRINPQVLVVILQKEQGLVTASGSRLTSSRYKTAMGYGCPDTAACNTMYYGFFNQVYSAAAQFRNYANNPTRWAHRVGVVNNIYYYPPASRPECGTKAVYIENQATASLYNYTPYTPNDAALAAGYGTGDACSSYGNRNFWNYFRDWFGPTTDRAPIGYIDSVTTTDRSITVSGWALDPDTRDPIAVHIYVNGVPTAFRADNDRPDLEPIFHKGAAHGFTATVSAPVGADNVCVWALNDSPSGVNPGLMCRVVTVSNALPQGALDVAEAAHGEVRASGWAYDPDTASSAVGVDLVIDGVATPVPANQPRPASAPPFGDGTTGGFVATRPVGDGPHTVCVQAHDSLHGAAQSLACVAVGAATPLITPVAPAVGITAITPTRLADTWVARGSAGPRCFNAADAGAPAGATGVVVNVAAVSPAGEGNVVMFPSDGTASPTPPAAAASVNFEPGHDVANAAFVKIGDDGRICWSAQSFGPARVVLDVTGFTMPDSGLALQNPTRLLDTRPGAYRVGELSGGLAQRRVQDITVAGRAGVPADARAVILNVTVVTPEGMGNLRVYPAGGSRTPPDISTVNYAAGKTKSNAVVVPLGADGKIALYSDALFTAPVEVVLDVTGYVSADGLAYQEVAPHRVLDTRPSAPAALRTIGTLKSRNVYSVNLRVAGVIPPEALTMLLNVTAVHPTTLGNLRVYPDTDGTGATPPPAASSINYIPGRDIPALVVVAIPESGQVNLYSDQFADGVVEVTIDVIGYTARPITQ